LGKFKEMMIDEDAFSPTPLPAHLRAAITIMAADPHLVCKALPHVDIDHQEVKWDEILKNEFDSGQKTALSFAKAIAINKVEGMDPFNLATEMNPKLKAAVLRGLAIHWGLAS
jgi:hypothetical protein